MSPTPIPGPRSALAVSLLCGLALACDDGDGSALHWDPAAGGSGGAGGAGGVELLAPSDVRPAERDAGTPVSPSTVEVPTGERTGNARVDQMLAAAEACGPQSPSTTPAGWSMVPTGEAGCTFSAPPGWQVIGAGEPATAIQRDEGATAGFLVMSGVPDSALLPNCTPAGLSEMVEAVIGRSCTPIERLHFETYTEEFAGVALPAADLFFACGPGVGYFWLTVQGDRPLCQVLAMGVWLPESELSLTTCTLTQIMQSARCPMPGANVCIDAECNARCIEDGSERGACDADLCVCG